MSRKLSVLLAAAALSLSGGLVYATDFAPPATPISIDDSTPWLINSHEGVAVESSRAAAATGETRGDSASRTVGAHVPGSYAVPTPTSVDDSTPWLNDRLTAPSVFVR